MQRFLVAANLLAGESVTLEGAAARQISLVLRMAPGEHITLIDGQDSEAECVLVVVAQRQVTVRVLNRTRSIAEPALRIHLFPALLRATRFELALQKATELGVAAITPVLAQRSVARPAGDVVPERWKSIVREAVEQSGRGRLPALQAPIAFESACAEARQADLALCCSAHGGVELRTLFAQGIPRTLAVIIGPEGGLTPTELIEAAQAGLQAVTLGPRILRAETATMAICAAALCLAGDWR